MEIFYRIGINSLVVNISLYIFVTKKINFKFGQGIYNKSMDTNTPYTHDELPLIETAEPVSSFVLIHLRRSPFFLALPVLSRKRTFLRSKLAFRGDDYCLTRTFKYLHIRYFILILYIYSNVPQTISKMDQIQSFRVAFKVLIKDNLSFLYSCKSRTLKNIKPCL